MTTDPLSTLLRRTGVRGSVFARAELGAPWSISTRGSGSPGPGRPAIFHVVVRGAGFVQVEPDGERAATAEAPERVAWRSGDVLLMPHGDPHVMSSDEDTAPTPISTLAAPMRPDGLACITHGGDGPRTSILCGTFHFDRETAELLRPQLPALLHLRCADGPAAAWLDATLRLLGAEVNAALPGSETVVARLADVLFVHAIRSWIAEAPPEMTGWLSALGDPKLARVLALIHAEPTEPWTAASLARRAGMSRSALFTRFKSRVGEAPASYLTRWRMHLAAQALRRGASLSEAASAVGYASDAAFSRAFCRATGQNPGKWRATHAAV